MGTKSTRSVTRSDAVAAVHALVETANERDLSLALEMLVGEHLDWNFIIDDEAGDDVPRAHLADLISSEETTRCSTEGEST